MLTGETKKRINSRRFIVHRFMQAIEERNLTYNSLKNVSVKFFIFKYFEENQKSKLKRSTMN